MVKLSENPAILTPEVQSLTELNGTWWVAHTRPRFEKVFAWDMSSRGIGYFLPVREKITFSGGRKRRVMGLLFSSYVFFCGIELDCNTALSTNRLYQTIEVVDQDGLIRELARIEKALLSKAIIDLWYRFWRLGSFHEVPLSSATSSAVPVREGRSSTLPFKTCPHFPVGCCCAVELSPAL